MPYALAHKISLSSGSKKLHLMKKIVDVAARPSSQLNNYVEHLVFKVLQAMECADTTEYHLISVY